MTVKLNELQPLGEVASNPVLSHATYTIVFEFVKQNITVDGIKGLRKIKENANGMFIVVLPQRAILRYRKVRDC